MLEAIDPWGQIREDFRNAHLMALIANVMGGKKSSGASWTVADFILDFKTVEEKPPLKTPAEIEAMFRVWIDANNLRFASGVES